MPDIEIEFLNNGEISFCRCDKETNEHILEIIMQLIDKKDEAAVAEFLDGSEDIETLLGENLCG